MHCPPTWINIMCKQKRILILLCTFGTSFIAFNYTLLSSSLVTSQSVVSFIRKGELEIGESLTKKFDKGGSSNVERSENWTLRSKESSIKAIYRDETSHARNHVTSKNASSTVTTNGFPVTIDFVHAHLSKNDSNSEINVAPDFKRSLVENIEKTDESNSAGFLLPASSTNVFGEKSRTSSSVNYGQSAIRNDFVVLPSSIPISSLDSGLFSSSSPSPPIQVDFPSSNNSNSGGNNSNNVSSFLASTFSITNLPSSFHIPACNTTAQLRRIQKRKKNLIVIENFIMGWKHFACNETVTYTTHGDYRYLDNLVPLVDRWNGPVSLAIYCPGSDLDESLKLISYLKLCTSSNINKWVTFHLLYDANFVKRPARTYVKHGDIPWLDALYEKGKWKDCSQKPTFSKGDYTFRIQNGLLYPINIARNIARAAATTFFVLPSDIELYPSINLIPSFMEMLERLEKEEERKINFRKKNTFTAAAAAVVAKLLASGNSISNSTVSNANGDNVVDDGSSHGMRPQQTYRQPSKHVFVLPVFEVKKDIVPCQVETKEQLVSLLRRNAAVVFHHSICPQCHTFPKYREWKGFYTKTSTGIKDSIAYNCTTNASTIDNTKTSLRIFHKAKRKAPFQLWEPIFIGTKEEPIYDERLSWEGLRDKMVSGYVMCALDYDFYILDNAFLVHKPGIRKVNHLVTKTVMSQDRLINYRIRSELLRKFGKHDECAL